MILDPTNKVISDTTAKILVELFKGGMKASVKVWEWGKDEAKARDFFGTAARKYGDKFIELYDRIKVIGMTERIYLADIFVRVNILEKIISWQGHAPEEMEEFEKLYRMRGGFGDKKVESVDGVSLVNQKEHLMLLGQPGGGKTTFLKYIGLQALEGKLEHNRIPVFITLRRLADNKQTLLEYIVSEFDICDFPDAKPFIEHQLKNGKLLLLLDGLDEVGKSSNKKICDDVNRFCDKYSKNQFIVSCRTAAYNQNFPCFTDVELSDFNEEQIKSFIDKWFYDDKEKAKTCKEKLYLPDNEPILELAKTPLLLTLLCLAFGETLKFASNRSELYKKALDALLEKWDSSRNIERDEIYRHLSTPRKEQMLSRIACEAFDKEKYFIPQKTLEEQIAAFIENLPEAKIDTLIPDSRQVLKAIEAQHGILVERTDDIYSFSHLTFHEYFTARYIVDNTSKGTLPNLVEHITDSKWREVFLLTAGMLPEADEFLKLMKKKTDALIKDEALIKLLSWAKEKADSLDLSYKKSALRAYYIYLDTLKFGFYFTLAPVLALDLDLEHALDPALVHALDHAPALALDHNLAHVLNHNLTRALDRAKEMGLDSLVRSLEELNADIPSKEDTQSDCSAWAERLLVVMIKERNIGHDFGLNNDSLGDYLYANKLIVDCLNCDSYVTKEVREEILDTLLLPPGN